MKILFLDQFSDLGGAQRCLLDLLPAVVARGWKAHVAAPGTGRLRAEAISAGATFDAIHCGPYASGRKSFTDVLRFVSELPRLADEIRALADRYDADLLYVNGPRLLPAVARVAKAGRPVLFHCHSFLSQAYARWLANRSVRRARATVVGSCRFVLQPYPEPHDVVYNGVAQCPHSHRPRGAEWRIGVIGRIAPEKGQAQFLRAARLVPGARFVICGEPLFSAPQYSALVRSLAEGLPVEFLGWRDDVYSGLAVLDLLVVPSVAAEANPRVILEAFAAGVPVVAFRSGGIPEIITDGETGFLADPPSPEALAEKIRAVMSHLPASIVANAREEWRRKYTLTRYRERMLERIERAGRAARETAAPQAARS